MSDIILPIQVKYDIPAALPECNTIQCVVSPSNTTSLGPNSLLQFDLASKGFLVPNSMYIRYRATALNSAATPYIGSVVGTPVYTFFSKSTVFAGASTIETINNYHQTLNMWSNLQLNIAEKYGSQLNYGYDIGQNGIDSQDGRSFGAAAVPAIVGTAPGASTWSMAAYLPNCLSMANKMIPMHLMPGCRIELNTASASDVFSAQTTADMSYLLSNVELVYDIVLFSGETNDIIASQGEKIFIKTQSFVNIGTPIQSGFLGNTEVIFNTRLSSIKSLFSIMNPIYRSSGTGNLSTANNLMDSIDITSGSGSLQWTVAAVNYPTREVSTSNRASVMMELKKACGNMNSTHYATSINIPEFSYSDLTFRNHVVAGQGTAAPSSAQPGKFYFGANLEKISSGLLTGVSSMNSPLSLRLNTSVGTAGAYMIYCIMVFDQLIIIDVANRSVEVKQ